jgi:hypothetical protein
MTETMCECDHPRRVHSRNGCAAYLNAKTREPCPCKIPYMQVGKRRSARHT